ncbi:MAG: hypothetical protein ABXS92_02505 [Sulfurimonas sp.]
MKKGNYLLVLGLMVFIGCEQGNVSKARLMDDTAKKDKTDILEQKKIERNETLELQKVIGANQVALAKIEADKLRTLKTMELEQSKVKAQETVKLEEKKIAYEKEAQAMKLAQEKELALVQEKRLLANQDNQNSLYKTVLVVSALLVLLILLLLLWVQRKNRAQKANMHEETLRHEEFMQASQQHHEKITKMLDIVVDEKTDKNVKKELVKLLKEQGEGPALLLEEQKKQD